MKTLHQLKDALKMSNEAIARHLECSERTVRRWLGGNPVPRQAVLRNLESLLSTKTTNQKGKP